MQEKWIGDFQGLETGPVEAARKVLQEQVCGIGRLDSLYVHMLEVELELAEIPYKEEEFMEKCLQHNELVGELQMELQKEQQKFGRLFREYFEAVKHGSLAEKEEKEKGENR
jgi:hypothetical protein